MTDPLVLVDLTSLNEDDTPAVARDLCAQAVTPYGHVAAVCVMPALVGVAVEALGGAPVKVATVANFPAGEDDAEGAAAECRGAVAAGADEVDVVVPWRAQLAGDAGAVARMTRACVEACAGVPLKVILETGSHPDAATTRAMADAALAEGAAFLKTSTGKVGAGASPEAARVLLEAVRAEGRGGVKVSGGVRAAGQADAYVALAAGIMGPDWVAPSTFRIGASSLLAELVARHEAS